MVNGAIFVASGEGVEVKYEKAYSVEPKSAVLIDQLTMHAGALGVGGRFVNFFSFCFFSLYFFFYLFFSLFLFLFLSFFLLLLLLVNNDDFPLLFNCHIWSPRNQKIQKVYVFTQKKEKESVCLYWTALPKFYIEAQSFCMLTRACFRWADFKTESRGPKTIFNRNYLYLLNYLSCYILIKQNTFIIFV